MVCPDQGRRRAVAIGLKGFDEPFLHKDIHKNKR